jgi:hypothetical protein
MTATAALTTDLQRQVLILEDDLRARLAADPVRQGEWKQEHQRATDKDRTALHALPSARNEGLAQAIRRAARAATASWYAARPAEVMK